MGGGKKSSVVVTCPTCGKPVRLVSVEAGKGTITKTYHCDSCDKEYAATEPL